MKNFDNEAKEWVKIGDIVSIEIEIFPLEWGGDDGDDGDAEKKIRIIVKVE